MNNSAKAFGSMLEESPFGIDYGYFLGSLSKRALDPSKNELIQVKLTVPKGTKISRVGNIIEDQFILLRDHTYRYGDKKLNTKNKLPNVEISAELVQKEALEEATQHQTEVIQSQLESRFGIQPDFITLKPVGLNAGYVLTHSLDTVLKAFTSLESGGVLSKDLFNKEKVTFTNGFIVHTDIFSKWSAGLDLAERRKIFEKKYQNATGMGITQNWPDRTSESIVSFSYLDIEEPIPQNSVSDGLSSTLLHEFFHYFIYSSNSFVGKPMFQNDSGLFRAMAELFKRDEGNELVDLLNNDYAEQDWEEFICEAFMAKFHPQEEIRRQFREKVIQTNRL